MVNQSSTAHDADDVTWPKPIPSIPDRIVDLSNEDLRRRAIDAWRAAQTLRGAISTWHHWLKKATLDFSATTRYDVQTDDAISRAGASAIRTLCRLNPKCVAFSGDSNELLRWWPCPPSEILDQAWYFDQDPTIQKHIQDQLSYLLCVLAPAVEEFLQDLAISPQSIVGYESRAHWTPAVFLDRAEELRRRLKVWQVRDPIEPIWLPSFLEVQKEIRRQFRSVILDGDHGPKPEPSVQLYPGWVSAEQAARGIAGSAFHNPPTDLDKQLTCWLLRDFYEHLSDAGTTHQAEYLRLTVERILDAQIYCTRGPSDEIEQQSLHERNSAGKEGPYSLIGGRDLDQSLLNNLVAAANGLLGDHAASEANPDADISGKSKQSYSAIEGDEEAKAIVELIRKLGHRLTTNQVLSEFNTRGMVKAESTTKLKLSFLTKLGILNNRTDTKPRGYGLCEWKE